MILIDDINVTLPCMKSLSWWSKGSNDRSHHGLWGKHHCALCDVTNAAHLPHLMLENELDRQLGLI